MLAFTIQIQFKHVWTFFLSQGLWGDSPVSQAPGSHLKMLITQPRSKKNQNGPRTSLMGPGGAVWGEKTDYKKSRETVPLSDITLFQIQSVIWSVTALLPTMITDPATVWLLDKIFWLAARVRLSYWLLGPKMRLSYWQMKSDLTFLLAAESKAAFLFLDKCNIICYWASYFIYWSAQKYVGKILEISKS